MKINKLFLVLCIGLLAFASCKKDDPKPQEDNTKVILAKRTASGDIVSLVDCEKVMEQMKKDNATKDLTDNYIVESVQVIDKMDDKPFCFVISLLDVENETTIRLAYIGDFVEEEENFIYAAEEFARGNYKVIEPYGEEYDPEAEGEEFNFVDHRLVNGSKQDGSGTMTGFWVKCESRGCSNASCMPNYFKCTACQSSNVDDPGVCHRTWQGWGTTTIITVGAGIIGAIIRAFTS